MFKFTVLKKDNPTLASLHLRTLKKAVTYFLIFLVSFSNAQFDSAKFMKAFDAARGSEKLKLATAYGYRDLQPVYYLIKDSIYRIKGQVVASSALSKQRDPALMLIDRLEFDKWMYEQNYREAIMVVENALWHHAINLNDSLRCFRMLKNANVKLNNFNKAFEYEFMLQDFWPKKKDTTYLDYGYTASSMYFILGLKSEAIKQRRIEFKDKKGRHSDEDLVNYYNDMGVFFDPDQHPDSSAFYFIKAKEILAKIKPEPGRESYYIFYNGLVDGNLGMCYRAKGQYAEAIALLKNDLRASVQTSHFQSGFNAAVPLALCYIAVKDKKTAKAYLDTSDILAAKARINSEDKLELLEAKAQYSHFTGDFKTATDLYRQYHELNDSLEVTEREAKLIAQGVALEIERRALEFSEKENSQKQEQLERRKDDLLRIYVIVGFLVSLFVIVILIVNNRSFKKRESQLSHKNEQIQVQHAQIEHTLKEKEALIKEIHHRVKNNLQIINSMLNLQIGKIEDEKTETILFEARQRINAIALTHQMLYQRSTISSIHLGEYVETLVHQIEAAMSQSNITTIVQISPSNEKLTIDGAVPLGLVINELLTNAYKHAFPTGRNGLITVSLTDNEDSFTVSVADNGSGLAEAFSYSESKTLGMELVFILVEQLESKLNVKTEKDKGTTFSFDIKKNKQTT